MPLVIILSLLTLIARVFSPYKKRIQALYILGVLLVAYYVASFVSKIIICWPICVLE
jgi:lipopolysaccharide export LptBFGC system permease protein LptF